MDAITVILLVVSLTCFVVLLCQKKPQKRLPPSLPGHPLIGGWINLFRRPVDSKAWKDFIANKEIYTVPLGSFTSVHLNSYRAMHEALVGQADAFSGRQKGAIIDAMIQDSGIASTDGPKWQEHRRFVMRLLRDFGMGRPQMEQIITEECSALKEVLERGEGSPMSSQEIFSTLTNNVIARLVFGERTGTNDANFKSFCKHLQETFKLKPVLAIIAIFPFILKVPFLLKWFDYVADTFCHIDAIYFYIKQKIDQQAEALRSLTEPLTDVEQANNVCEAYLIEQANQQAANPDGHTFTEPQLVRTMVDLFSGGTETTATTLNWAMLLLATNPQVQARLQKEIKEQIGRTRAPTWADRHCVPYVCAVMDEVMRVGLLTPLNIPHRVTKDTELLGYDIPKDMIVWCNLTTIYNDPKLWEKPKEMYPEHFLTSDGEYKPSQYLIPFSMGKRACPGESLARVEFFLVLVSVMQSFSVRLADPSVDAEAILRGTTATLVRHPLPHEVTFEKLED